VESFIHPAWEDGMGSSLAAGMKVLLESFPDLDGVFVLLSDQPMISVGLLESMAGKIREPGISIILTDHGDATGPPSLFASRHFAELAALQGDQGAKAVAGKHAGAVAKQPFPEGTWDIDSPEVWERFTRSRAASSVSGSR
jgi:molybdenum cofactor cytidylyltransferase